jgi:hypothetical protein
MMPWRRRLVYPRQRKDLASGCVPILDPSVPEALIDGRNVVSGPRTVVFAARERRSY